MGRKTVWLSLPPNGLLLLLDRPNQYPECWRNDLRFYPVGLVIS